MRTVNDYLALPYAIDIRKDVRENIFVARVAELPGCSAHGQTQEEALANVRDNMAAWIEDCLESGDPIPLPQVEQSLPSGKWLQRTPRSLHLRLIKLAKQEGVSLNQLVISLLSEAVGAKTTVRSAAKSATVLPWLASASLTPEYAVGNRIQIHSVHQSSWGETKENFGDPVVSVAGVYMTEHIPQFMPLASLRSNERTSHVKDKKHSVAYEA